MNEKFRRGVPHCRSAEWLQVVPWDPPLEDGRDDAVLIEYLEPRQMISWIQDVLNGYPLIGLRLCREAILYTERFTGRCVWTTG